MSITALQVQALPVSGGASVRGWLDDMERMLARTVHRDVSTDTDHALVESTRRLTSVLSRVAAVKLAVLAEVDRRNAARRTTGATSTAAWLRGDGMSPGAAHREVRLAGALGQHEATRAAMQAGWINPEQAQVITDALGGLSDAVDAVDKAAVEERLLVQAGRLDPGQLRKEAVAAAARIDPTGSGDLARMERAARAGRELVFYKGSDGMHHLRGALDTEAAATLAAALDPLAAPAPADDAGGKDPRSAGRRLADALVELARRALAGGALPVTGGLRPQVVVTMTLDQLQGHIEGCAQIAGSTVREPLSAAAARRIACDAAIIPAVLGGASQVLDWGRAARTATPAQRRALALRDGGCTHPGCDRPPEWCQAHHLSDWDHGGPTDLNGLALVCDQLHGIAHHDGWTLTLNDDNQIVWTPPPTPPPEPPRGGEAVPPPETPRPR